MVNVKKWFRTDKLSLRILSGEFVRKTHRHFETAFFLRARFREKASILGMMSLRRSIWVPSWELNWYLWLLYAGNRCLPPQMQTPGVCAEWQRWGNFGQWLGKRLGEQCIRHAISQGGTLVLCTARISASTFYHNLGFKKQGEAFHLPEYSDEWYILMLLDTSAC